jgi:hypothetical protein
MGKQLPNVVDHLNSILHRLGVDQKTRATVGTHIKLAQQSGAVPASMNDLMKELSDPSSSQSSSGGAGSTSRGGTGLQSDRSLNRARNDVGSARGGQTGSDDSRFNPGSPPDDADEED